MQIHGEVKDQPSGNLKKIDCVVLKVEPKMATATFCYARTDHAPKKNKKIPPTSCMQKKYCRLK